MWGLGKQQQKWKQPSEGFGHTLERDHRWKFWIKTLWIKTLYCNNKNLRFLLDVLVCCLCVCVFKMFCPTFLFARFYSRWFPTRRSLLIRNRVPVSAGRLEAFSAQSPEKEWQSEQLREKWRGFSEVVWIAKRSNSELRVLIPFPKIWQKLDI